MLLELNSFFEVELSLDTISWKSIELTSVCLDGLDVVDKVLGLLEQIKVFSIDHISQIIFDSDNKLNHIERVESMVLKLRVESEFLLLSCSKVVSADIENVIDDFIVGLESEGVMSLVVGPESRSGRGGYLGNVSGFKSEAVHEVSLWERSEGERQRFGHQSSCECSGQHIV